MSGSDWVNSLLRPLSLAALLCACALAVHAQHGGHGISINPGNTSRPDGVDEKDTLKDFHQVIAVQATSQQIKDFQELLKKIDSARQNLTTLQPSAGRDSFSRFNQLTQDARDSSKKFEAGFSEVQRSGLRDYTKRVDKADSDLEQELHRLDLALRPENSGPDVSARATDTGKALTAFSEEQLALGREMSITLASANDVTFNLPPVQNTARIGAQSVSVTSSGVLSQTKAEGDVRSFQLAITLELSDLQQRIAEILHAAIERPASCGERLDVRHATIMGGSPASSLVLQLHFERWSCGKAFGSSPVELAEGDGSVELALTPAVDKSNALSISGDYKRIQATGMMGDELHSDLGTDLKEKVAATILAAANAGLNAKTSLPSALQGGSTLRSARFQELGAGGLALIADSDLQLSNAQVTSLANQLNQALSAQSKPAQQ